MRKGTGAADISHAVTTMGAKPTWDISVASNLLHVWFVQDFNDTAAYQGPAEQAGRHSEDLLVGQGTHADLRHSCRRMYYFALRVELSCTYQHMCNKFINLFKCDQLDSWRVCPQHGSIWRSCCEHGILHLGGCRWRKIAVPKPLALPGTAPPVSYWPPVTTAWASSRTARPQQQQPRQHQLRQMIFGSRLVLTSPRYSLTFAFSCNPGNSHKKQLMGVSCVAHMAIKL